MTDTIKGRYGQVTLAGTVAKSAIWETKRFIRSDESGTIEVFRLESTTSSVDNSLNKISFNAMIDAEIAGEDASKWPLTVILQKNGNVYEVFRLLLGNVASAYNLCISKELWDMIVAELVNMSNPYVEFNVDSIIDLLRTSYEPKIIEWLQLYDGYLGKQPTTGDITDNSGHQL